MLENHVTLPSDTPSPTYQYKKQRIPFPDDMPSFQKQHQEYSHEKLFLVISIVIFILGFTSGIVCGNVFCSIVSPTQTYDSIIGSSTYTSPAVTAFNSAIMITIWAGAAILGLLFLAISFHFKNQKRIVERLDLIINK